MRRIASSRTWGAERWDKFYMEQGDRWRDKDYHYLMEVMNLGALEGTLLDVGCGLGDGQLVLYQACAKATEFSACDFSCQAVMVARTRTELARTKFFQHDLAYPLGAKWDSVICLQTIEHVANPVSAFQHVVDAARKVAIVGCPYRNRRPDEDHRWSFCERDVATFGPVWTLGQDATNIYWIIDKTGAGLASELRIAKARSWDTSLAGRTIWEAHRFLRRVHNRWRTIWRLVRDGSAYSGGNVPSRG